ncbi:MAG: hypothetical protein M1838_002374 [Thelocarpon superellum]|nr:MAG: hypothetical protein M1838_002374 [Thelocarpon superellum]
MAANVTSEQARRPSRSSFGGGPHSNGKIALEKTRVVGRQSTPDSEVLASSDDEAEKHGRDTLSSNAMPPKPTRRSSWLSDVQTHAPRRSSFASGGPLSPGSTNAQPPSSDATWGSLSGAAVGRTHPANNSFTWGSGIWNNEPRKEPPARLTEVLPSPTSVVPPASPPTSEGEAMVSPGSRDHVGDSTIPFAIPLHPTPKTYRSQSYSVGQLDHEVAHGVPTNLPGAYVAGRMRSNQPAGLQHRPHRPSLLGDLSHEGTSLDRVREVDDDDESTNGSGSQQGAHLSASDGLLVESFGREHGTLGSTAAAALSMKPWEKSSAHGRAASSDTASNPFGLGQDRAGIGHRVDEPVPEESEYAIDELEDRQGFNGPGPSLRRYSEYSTAFDTRLPSFPQPENRKLENLKKGHWQSSLGFGGVADGPQSRRHSFADVPARNGSITSIGEVPARYRDGAGRTPDGDAPSYFSQLESNARNGLGSAPVPASASLHQAYLMQGGSYGSGRPPSPTNGVGRGMAGLSPHAGLAQPRQDQLLCVVTFKCCRSDVFYIQEGTGLEVNTGDMVIVEADRGTDLGTVAQVNVTWNEAKFWKEKFAEEHYKWLMLFSRHSGQAENGTGIGHGGLLSNHGAVGSAVGGMGPQGGQRGAHEPTSGELKPKMIKRLAQHHEVQSLRDKEGNEAKAKRVCQQKVVEHRLQMEVLDAEFQVDWKKLTFYYFADAYINFNSLVTDLFKIYKTRIWMSAINPASFATPSAGLQPPSGIGPGALGVGAEGLAEHHPTPDASPHVPLGPYRGFAPSFARPVEHGPDRLGPALATLATPFAYTAPSYGPAPRVSPGGPAEYGRSMPPVADGLAEFRPVDFGGFRPGPSRGPSYFDHNVDRRAQLAGNEGLTASFHGLSLGPR